MTRRLPRYTNERLDAAIRLTVDATGWTSRDLIADAAAEYLTGGNKNAVKGYRWLYILAVFIGPFMTVSAVWTIADIFNGLMAIPNLIALLALNGVVVAETKSYFKRFPNGPIKN